MELRRLHAEQRRSVERGIAHAQMPDTMYASTPDPAPPPHAVPIELKRPSAPARLAPLVPAPHSAPSPGHRLPLLVSASGASEREGVVRLGWPPRVISRCSSGWNREAKMALCGRNKADRQRLVNVKHDPSLVEPVENLAERGKRDDLALASGLPLRAAVDDGPEPYPWQ